jgi:hypothetical protein
MSAPPDGYFPPSSIDTEDDEEEEDEDDNNAAKAAQDDESTTHSIPDYEEDTYSTPQRRTSTSSIQREPEYVPRRLSHPGNRPAQAPSPMRASKMKSPLGRRTSPSAIRSKPLRSPQTIVRKRKRSSPQQIVPDAIESSPVSSLRLEKSHRFISSPKEEQIQNPDEHDEALNRLQINAGHHTFNSIAIESSVTVIDSGASMSGTGDRALLRYVRPTTLTVSSAFGDSQRWETSRRT